MGLQPFNVGDKTYVVELNPADDLPRIYEREVVRVSAKQLEIHGATGRVIHRPLITAIGQGGIPRWSPIVFATPEAALEMYIEQRQGRIETAKRRVENEIRWQTRARALLQEIQRSS